MTATSILTDGGVRVIRLLRKSILGEVMIDLLPFGYSRFGGLIQRDGSASRTKALSFKCTS